MIINLDFYGLAALFPELGTCHRRQGHTKARAEIEEAHTKSDFGLAWEGEKSFCCSESQRVVMYGELLVVPLAALLQGSRIQLSGHL